MNIVNLKDIHKKYVEEQMEILSHQTIISNQADVKVLQEIQNKYMKYPFIMLQWAFTFGKIIQKRSYRDLKKWNKIVCFYNMHAYAERHNGELPKTYSDLMRWVNRKEVGDCHG